MVDLYTGIAISLFLTCLTIGLWTFKPEIEKISKYGTRRVYFSNTQQEIIKEPEFADLKIIYNPNDPDQYCFIGQEDNKKYITVCVENNGNAIARKCKARLKITQKKDTRYPSKEWKYLRWAYKDTEKMTINAKDKEFLNVIFSVEKPAYNMSAFFANAKSINFPEHPREKDGCPEGEYEFTILINAEKGESVQSKFRISVTSNWKELFMQQIE